MFGREYYTLVAGLREYSLDSENKGFDAKVILDEIREQLSKKDLRTLRLFYTWYDIENILHIKAGRSAFNTLGNYGREELEAEVQRPQTLPPFIGRILTAFADPDNADSDEVDTAQKLERALFAAYYEACAKSSNGFLRNWSAFDRNLRNVIAAFSARSKGWSPAEVVVGGGDVVDALTRSSAADFGLKGELEYLDTVIAAMNDEGNLVEKERRIDLVRWDKSEELTAFNYFDMDAILGYLVRVNIVHRWTVLSPAVGREMYERLVASLGAGDRIRQAEERELLNEQKQE